MDLVPVASFSWERKNDPSVTVVLYDSVTGVLAFSECREDFTVSEPQAFMSFSDLEAALGFCSSKFGHLDSYRLLV